MFDTESSRDQEEGGELDSHEEVRLSFAGAGDQDQEEGGGAGPSGEPRRDQEQGGGAGLRKLDLSFASELFLSSSAADIVLVSESAPHSSSDSNCVVH